jgi:hypothetical protein
MERLIQRQIVVLGEVQPPEWLDEQWIVRCRSEKDAIALCWAKRRRKSLTVRQAAEELGIPASHLSNIIAGKKYLPHDFRARFQQMCGNWAIRQYEDLSCGFLTTQETPEQRENRLLRARLAKYEGGAAAA